MQNIQFNRTNGNVPKTLPGEDHISGLLFYMPTADIPAVFTPESVQLVSQIETAEKLGITADAEAWHVKVLHYHLSEIYRLNPGIKLYLGIYAEPTTATFAEVEKMQRYAGGDIRQLGVYITKDIVAADVTALQGMATTLEAADMPLSIIYAPRVANVESIASELQVAGQKNVSIIISEDAAGVAATLRADDNTTDLPVTAIGIALGILSKAKVNESIAWVKMFPTGVSLPAFVDGALYRDLDSGVIEGLDTAGYLFFVTYSGLGGAYFNDSHNMDVATSDYSKIELVRTMDKAVRGIRTYLLPELGSPLYVDPETGKLDAPTVKHLEMVASTPLEAMNVAGELSGYSVEIDPDQNVLATSTVEFVIKNAAVGVFRKGVIKIGYTTSTNA